MCTVFVIRDRLEGHPVVIAANRDEMLVRPWSPPMLVQAAAAGSDEVDAVMPVDDVAGGTWLGVNAAGVLLAVTNRVPGKVDRALPSRGVLAKEALHQPTLAAALDVVRGAVARSRFNGFNVIAADAARTVWLSLRDDRLEEQDLGPGVHVVTSLHDLDPTLLDDLRAELDSGARAAGTFHALLPTARKVLSDHEPRGPLYAVCKHGDTYGTRSAAVFGLTATRLQVFSFAPGRPCENDFERVTAPPIVVR